MAANKISEGLGYIDSVLAVNDSNVLALTQLYKAHQALNTASLAVERIKQAYSKNKADVIYQLLYAQVLFDQKQYNKVPDVLTIDSAKTSSQLTPYWLLLGESYIKLKKTDKAHLVFSTWADMQPKNKVAWLSIASIYARNEQFLDALSSIERASKHFANDSQLKKIKIHYFMWPFEVIIYLRNFSESLKNELRKGENL